MKIAKFESITSCLYLSVAVFAIFIVLRQILERISLFLERMFYMDGKAFFLEITITAPFTFAQAIYMGKFVTCLLI